MQKSFFQLYTGVRESLPSSTLQHPEVQLGLEVSPERTNDSVRQPSLAGTRELAPSRREIGTATKGTVQGKLKVTKLPLLLLFGQEMQQGGEKCVPLYQFARYSPSSCCYMDHFRCRQSTGRAPRYRTLTASSAKQHK